MRGLLFLLAGCGFTVSAQTAEDDGGNGADAKPIDAQMLDGCTTFSTVVDTCLVGTYGPAVSITGMKKYDTGTHLLSDLNGANAVPGPMYIDTMINGGPITLLVVDGFRVESGASLRVVGPRSFGVVSSAAVTIAGILDGTGTTDEGGAGARGSDACGMSAGRDGNDHPNGNITESGGASGGGGGGFRSAGANGGTGDNDGTRITGATAGIAMATMPTQIIGGCQGGGGGDQGLIVIIGNGRSGGDGGAGVFITSAVSITVSGQLNVGGGGGSGGASRDAGGAGGGSGGMVLLEAPSVAVPSGGALTANGGGGGGGANTSSGANGSPGQPSTMAAPGGNGPGDAGDGGPGGANSQMTPAQPGDSNTGGAGGGGGVGWLFVKSGNVNIGGAISPPVSVWP